MLVYTGQETIGETKEIGYKSEYYTVKFTVESNNALDVVVGLGNAEREMKKSLPKIAVSVDNADKSVRVYISEHPFKGELEYQGLGRDVHGMQVAFAHMVEIDKLVTEHLQSA